MHWKQILWRLFLAYLIVILASLAALSWCSSGFVRRLYLKDTAEDLEARARLVGELIRQKTPLLDPQKTDQLCKSLDIRAAMRVTVILPSGRVIADSTDDPATMTNHADRSEIIAAVKGDIGQDVHFSDSLQVTMMYVSIPFYDADRIVAVVRTSVPIASIEHVLQKARTGIAACAVVLALLATVASLVITHRINRPMEEMHRRFVADVSHELRTPITSIKGFIETLLDGAMKNPADTERFLRIAARQSDRLYAIVEDLLTLSRLEQEKGDIQVVLEEVPLRQVLQNSIQVCESKAGDRNIDVHLTCGEHIIVRVNAALIEQAFVNLVDNAIKFSPAESTIWVEAREEKKDAVIHVRDEGSGIESKHIPRLFERFYRVDKARSRSLAGTGLGLAIVKHIVVLHRGRIHVESKPGKGSTFSVYLPRKSAQCRQS